MKRWAILLLTATGLAAQQAVLQPGQPVQKDIRSKETHVYRVALRTGEFVRGTLEQRGIAITLRGSFPDGTKLRTFDDPSTTRKVFRFVAEAPGEYRLDLIAMDAEGTGSYRLEIQQIQPMSERLKIVPEERYQSPRIVSLRRELESGNREALPAFWREVENRGTPLAEPIAGDESNLLVTFLWRATFEVHNVLVLWAPHAIEHPDDFAMRRLLDTDVWYKTLRVPKGARFLYQLSPNDTLTRAPNAQRFATAQVDPLNRRRRPDNPNLSKYGPFSIAELPGAKPQLWSEPKAGVEKGSVRRHRFVSTRLRNERNISVYTPPRYAAEGQPYPMILLFDEATYQTDVPGPTILDNLIAAYKVPPAVAVLVNYPARDARDRELLGNSDFADFIALDLVPWIRSQYHVSADPARTVIGGLSAGGFAAAYIGLRHSGIFGNVLVQSGAFWWAPNRDQGEEPNWLARQFAGAPTMPLKFFMEAGLFENDIRGSGGQILETSRHLRDVLLAKGYNVTYQEFPGGHDYLTWRGSLADGLIALLGTTPH
jgi:enterochelin esterase-like enzyme